MSDASFRMIIEDTFLIKGRGTVVVGIIEAGSIKKGDKVTLMSTAQKPMITATISSIDMMSQAMTTETIGLLVYSEKFHAMAEKGMLVISDESNRGDQ